VTVFTRDGKSVTRSATGREFIWDFDEEVRRIHGVVAGIPIPETQFDALIEACRHLDALDQADQLIRLTLT
jgi:hypothetical protein